MIFEQAKYKNHPDGSNFIEAVVSGQIWSVPIDPANTDYAEIMRQVDAGELTIEPADTDE